MNSSVSFDKCSHVITITIRNQNNTLNPKRNGGFRKHSDNKATTLSAATVFLLKSFFNINSDIFPHHKSSLVSHPSMAFCYVGTKPGTSGIPWQSNG